MSGEVVVTGMGVVTPLGESCDEFWKMLNAGASAVRSWDDLLKEGFRMSSACRINGYDEYPLERGSYMALSAARQALAQARVEISRQKIGVFVGSTMGESAAYEAAAGGEKINPKDYSASCFGRFLQRKLGFEGVSRTYSSACAAGNYAINAGKRMIEKGEIDVALVGGVDPFSRIAMAGFSKSRAMSAKGICKPFDQNRSGMILGEGAGFLVLESASGAIHRDVIPLAAIGGCGLSCDAYHPTAPDPSGTQIGKAMKTALSQTNLEARDVDWICAHGTGTKASDQVEAKAIREVFGREVPLTSSIKGAIGHSLGAASAIEAVVCVKSIQDQVIPGTTHCEMVDEEFQIPINLMSVKSSVGWVMNCGYGFGGVNSALLIGKWKS